MNLRKNNGFTGIDVTSAIIIVLIFIPTIFGTVYNLQRLNFAVDRKATAVSIAVDNLEKVKLEPFDVKHENEESTEKRDEVNYKVTVTEKYPSKNEELDKYLAKKVNVKVEYPIGTDVKSVEISTVIRNNV